MSRIRSRVRVHRPPSTGASQGGQAPVIPSDVDQTANLGTGNFSISNISGSLSSQPLGSGAFNFPNTFSGSGTFPLGTGNFSFTGNAITGRETGNLGTGNFSGFFSGSGLMTGINLGTGNFILSGTATGFGSGFAGRVTTSGTAWTNTGNAVDDDEDQAFISGDSAVATVVTDGMMILSGFHITGTIPVGWARNRVQVFIRHKWDNTVAVLSTATYDVTLVDSGNNFLQALERRLTNDSSSGAGLNLITSGYDVTANTTGLSTSAFNNMKLQFRSNSTLMVGGGNASAAVAWAAFRIDYNNPSIT